MPRTNGGLSTEDPGGPTWPPFLRFSHPDSSSPRRSPQGTVHNTKSQRLLVPTTWSRSFKRVSSCKPLSSASRRVL